MTSWYGGIFDETYRALRDRIPLKRPISLITVHPKQIKGLYGEAVIYTKNRRPSRYVIRIARNLDIHLARNILIHEYAHCLDVERGGKVAHGPSWGIAYAEIYSALFDEA